MGDHDDAQVRQQIRAQRLSRATTVAWAARERESWAGQPAAIYCRISHAKDDDQTGVERQERICREVAARIGLTVSPAHVFVDNNRSAWRRDSKRPGWKAMLETARHGGVRHIIAYHPDRLMRQPRDLEELLAISDDQGLTLHGEVNQRDLSDPDDRFMLRIEVAHACRSSDDTSRRLRSAMVDRAHDGKPHMGSRPYGYAKSGTAIIEEEAAIVREVFTRYLDGDSPVRIARDLVRRGVPTARGKSWTENAVRHLLESRPVAGIRVFRGEEIGRGEWPAIIDEGTFREVQERLSYRAAVTAPTRRPLRFYLLRGLVVCVECGTHMAGSSSAYQCTRRHNYDERKCMRKISAAPLEAFVKDAAIDLLERLTLSGSDPATALSEADQAAIAADRAELAELKDMWQAREISTREYRDMRKTIEERIGKLEAKTVVRPASTVLDGLTGEHAREKWLSLEEQGDHERLNAVLRFLFAAVIITPGRRYGNHQGGRFDFSRITIEQNPI